VLAHPLLLVGLAPALAELLRLGRPALEQPDRQQDEQRELQVLRLPVLHHPDAELGRGDVAQEGDPGVAVAVLVLVEVGLPGDRLEHQRGEEQAEEDERQSVVPDERAHAQLCIRPITAT
jgi:hypothetical protein